MSLAEQIRAIEERFGETALRSGLSGESEEHPRLATGWAEVDAALGGGLMRAALHEWFGVASTKNLSQECVAPASCRCVHGLEARATPMIEIGSKQIVANRDNESRRHAWMPPLLPLVHLVKQTMHDVSFAHRAVWIGRRCFPYGAALLGTRGDRRLLDQSIFVAIDGPADRLWAADLALRSPAVGLVIADGSGFDMAATRRIQLVAKAHHTTAFLARPPWEAREPSAAQTRWLVRWAEHDPGGSVPNLEPVNETSISLHPRWSLELLRSKGMQPDSCPGVWALEWDRGEGVVRLSTALARPAGDARASTSHRRLRQA